eukprot:133129-Pyramimonas_sp.AAC.1
MREQKMRVLTGNFYTLETNSTRKMADLEATIAAQAARLTHYELLEQDIDGAILQIATQGSDEVGREDQSGGDAGKQLVLTMGSAVPTAVQRRVQQSLTLAKKCTQLQRELESAIAEKVAAESELRERSQELERATQKLEYAQQPYNYLVEVLQQAERNLK